MTTDAEHRRLEEARETRVPWKKWGPYLSERQWGTVREDYSPHGTAWEYFPHDHARSRAYRWGEDGLAGISDDAQRLCFAIALWNGRDPILKERLFGLTNGEGNHGEDVKEYYFYLDSTPTHSYMKYLYKYPQRSYPYDEIVQKNRARSRREFEYELLDTGVFDDDRYFDVFVEYAKASAEDLLIRVQLENRGPDAATLHVLPTLWFRNTWSWGGDQARPSFAPGRAPVGVTSIVATESELGRYVLSCEGDVPLLFTENETNFERLFGSPNRTPYVKDGIDAAVVHGRVGATNPDATGTKVAAHYVVTVPAGGHVTLRLRLRDSATPRDAEPFGAGFDVAFADRRAEADAFYDHLLTEALGEDGRRIARQALAGMLWSKQYYNLDLPTWLAEHGTAHHGALSGVRNQEWFHMQNTHVISMPDKWEYPWYAAWDLAFHTMALGLVDVDFAKNQLELLLSETYLHPNGQMPAYEWNFGDVNPPVHAWAAYWLYQHERSVRGTGDTEFLARVFRKLLLNFTWWVNRKDPTGRNVFQGGFLGLDNIGVFDRSAALPTGGYLDQADGTAWMAFYCQSMLQMAVELATEMPSYEDVIPKFVEHFLWIASAMDAIGEREDEMWDEKDGFFYDVLKTPDGRGQRLRVRSLVGLLPLCASVVFPVEVLKRFPHALQRIQSFIARFPQVAKNIAPPTRPGFDERRLLAIVNEEKLRRVLHLVLDEREFLSPYGIRSISQRHRDEPFLFSVHGQQYRVDYEPAESSTGLFGGNSNWRGPIWFPINTLIVRALVQLYTYYGDDVRVECPTGSGTQMTLYEVAREISERLAGIFRRNAQGRRPVYGGTEKFQTDPHWRDLILFHEYFHGDNGAGLGASHQTGWTGLIAPLMLGWANTTAADVLQRGVPSFGRRAA